MEYRKLFLSLLLPDPFNVALTTANELQLQEQQGLISVGDVTATL